MALTAAEQHLVEAGQLARGAAPTAAGDAARHERGVVEHVQRHCDPRGGVVHRADARAVGRMDVGGHADPAVDHAERLVDLLAHVVLEAATVDAAHHLGEQRHARGEVVPRALARHPAVLRLHAADRLDDLLPVRVARRVALEEVGGSDARGVGEQVAQRDRVLALLRELGDVVGDAVVDLEVAALPLLRDRHRDARLGHREPRDHRLGRHRHPGARLADAEVGDGFAVERHVQLRTEVQATLDAAVDRGHCTRDRVGAHALDGRAHDAASSAGSSRWARSRSISDGEAPSPSSR